MFAESTFVTREYRDEQIPILENVTSLSVVNKGTSIATINGVDIYPSQKQILIVPDGTFSKVQLNVVYTPVVIRKGPRFPPKNNILLVYKKLI